MGAAFAAILILWASINTLIKTESDKISLESRFVDLKVESVKFDSGGNMFVRIKRNAFGSGEISGIAVIISDGNKNKVIQENEAIMQLEVKTFAIPKESLEGLGAIKTVSIAPILKSNSGKNTQNGIIDEKKLPENVDFVADENAGKPPEERKLIVID
jgi:hypothetical protein